MQFSKNCNFVFHRVLKHKQWVSPNVRRICRSSLNKQKLLFDFKKVFSLFKTMQPTVLFLHVIYLGQKYFYKLRKTY